MSRAIEDSKQKAIVVGGAIVPLEDRKIEIPPEQAKDFTPIQNSIEIGEVMEIAASKCDIREVLSPKQIKEFEAGRKENRPWKIGKER